MFKRSLKTIFITNAGYITNLESEDPLDAWEDDELPALLSLSLLVAVSAAARGAVAVPRAGVAPGHGTDFEDVARRGGQERRRESEMRERVFQLEMVANQELGTR